MGSRRYPVWVILIVGLLVSAARGAQVDPNQPRVQSAFDAWTRDGVTMKVLENGLTVVLKENHAAPVAAFRIYVKTGSMYEQEYLGAGISHLFEHLISGGTTSRRSEEESEKILDRIGGQNNAYTTLDHTCYHGTTLAKNLPVLIDVMADWMRNATFPQKEFDREVAVVTREVEMGQDNPRRMFYQAALQNAFRVHPIRHPVIGYLDLFKTLTRDDIVTYYKRTYTPNNMIVSAAGDFDSRKVLAVIEKAFGDFKRHGQPLPMLPAEPRQLGRRFLERRAPVRRARMMMVFHTVPLADPDLYPLDVISFVLSRGNSSRLVRRLRDTERLVYSISTYSATPHYGCGRFVVTMNLPYKNIRKVERAVLEELDRLKTEPVTAAELAKAKKQKIAEDVFGAQTVQDQAAEIAYNVMATGDPLFSATYVGNIQRTTALEMMRAARRYFTVENLSVTLLKPIDAKPPAGRTETTAAASPIRRVVLPNGIVLLLKRNPGPALVTIQTYFRGGVRSETDETNGLCRLAALMLTKGTRTRTGDQVAEYFDSIGGGIAGRAGRNTFFLTATVLAEDFEKALEVYADCLLNPTFPADELGKLRERTLAAIDQQNDDPFGEASLAFLKAFFRTQPYRFVPLGTRAAVERLTPADLAAYHRRWAVANNAVVAVFGDIDLDKAEAAVRRVLGPMRADPDFKPVPPSAEAPLEKDLLAARDTNKRQAVVVFGFRGMDVRNLDDRFAIDVLDAITSGIHLPGGWLHTALRGAGLVYVIHAYNFMGLDPGYFGGYAMCRPDKADEVVATIRRHLDRAKTAEIPDEELERARRMCITSRVLSRQTNADLATDAALAELYGLGLDFETRYPERINAITQADVRRVAKKYLTRWVVLVARPKPKPTTQPKP